MTKYKMWKDRSYDEKLQYKGYQEVGTKFEVSANGVYWKSMDANATFYHTNYYRIKQETSMTNDMTPFGKLDPVKQGEILVAFRNGDTNLQQWLWSSKVWSGIDGIRQIFNDTVYRIRAAPRECYVEFDNYGYSVKTSSYPFSSAILMREVMED
jgi:hypothetical protein